VCYTANVLIFESFQAANNVDKPKTVDNLFNIHNCNDLQWPQASVLAIVCSFLSFKKQKSDFTFSIYIEYRSATYG